jgi:tetratricopeptide (TPR) repeat protein
MGMLHVRTHATDTAVQFFERAKECAALIGGVRGDVKKAQLSLIIVQIVGRHDPKRAEEELRTARDLVENLPPWQPFLSFEDIRKAELLVMGGESDSDAAVELFRNQVEELKGHSGQAAPFEMAEILFGQARFEAEAGNFDRALDALQEARRLLEDHHRKGTTLYGFVVLCLAELLPDQDSDEVAELRETGHKLVEKESEPDSESSSNDDWHDDQDSDNSF